MALLELGPGMRGKHLGANVLHSYSSICTVLTARVRGGDCHCMVCDMVLYHDILCNTVSYLSSSFVAISCHH